MRRGYFVEGLGASQFGTTGAVDRLRGGTGGVGAATGDRRREAPTAVVLAASDPANPYGAALGWPDRAVDPAAADTEEPPDKRRRHQPGRKAGAVVVLVDGELVLYVERGGKTLLTYSDDPDLLRLPQRPSRMPCAAAAWGGSPSRRPTADSCSAPGTPSSPPSRRRASTSRRAVCGSVGDGQRACRPPGEHGDRGAHRRPQGSLCRARGDRG